MFQTIYNHICKIELRANNKQGNYFSPMQEKKKNYIGLAPPLKRICMRMFSLVFFFAITLYRVEITESKEKKNNKMNTHTHSQIAKPKEKENNALRAAHNNSK